MAYSSYESKWYTLYKGVVFTIEGRIGVKRDPIANTSRVRTEQLRLICSSKATTTSGGTDTFSYMFYSTGATAPSKQTKSITIKKGQTVVIDTPDSESEDIQHNADGSFPTGACIHWFLNPATPSKINGWPGGIDTTKTQHPEINKNQQTGNLAGMVVQIDRRAGKGNMAVSAGYTQIQTTYRAWGTSDIYYNFTTPASTGTTTYTKIKSNLSAGKTTSKIETKLEPNTTYTVKMKETRLYNGVSSPLITKTVKTKPIPDPSGMDITISEITDASFKIKLANPKDSIIYDNTKYYDGYKGSLTLTMHGDFTISAMNGKTIDLKIDQLTKGYTINATSHGVRPNNVYTLVIRTIAPYTKKTLVKTVSAQTKKSKAKITKPTKQIYIKKGQKWQRAFLYLKSQGKWTKK